MTDEVRQYAHRVLDSCVRPSGFFASGLPGGYEATWARDSMITSLGGATAGERYKQPFSRSLSLLGKNQSEHGQIPNAVGTWNVDRQSDVTFNSIDSTLWYLVGQKVYGAAYGDRSRLKKDEANIKKALTWLSYQDPNEDSLLVQQPTMDWQDAFPHKYGRVLLTQALYYAVLRMYGKKSEAEHLRRIVNGVTQKYLSLYDKAKGYYLPWIWKNHDSEREEEHWFDSLGNILAILTGLATPFIAKNIVKHIEAKGINKPYPCKAIFPPMSPRDKEWHSYFALSDAKKPFEYLNAGVWPFIGGFWVAALVRMGEMRKAKKELSHLARACKQINMDVAEKHLGKNASWGFQEWLHGRTGRAIGNSNPYQAWTAGAYLYAHACVAKKKALFFS